MTDVGPAFDLSVASGESSFSASGDPEKVMEAFAIFREWAGTAPPAGVPKPKRVASKQQTGNAGDAEEVAGEIDAGEEGLPLKPFLKQYNLTGNQKRGTAIIAWAGHNKDASAFKIGEVRDLWKTTDFKVPEQHLARDLKGAANEGWLSVNGKGANAEYSLNGFGAKQLETWKTAV